LLKISNLKAQGKRHKAETKTFADRAICAPLVATLNATGNKNKTPLAGGVGLPAERSRSGARSVRAWLRL
jgi:hypothetical protein